MRRDVRWRASPPGLRLARFRSIPLPPAYFHRFAILTHNPIAVFADRSKRRKRAVLCIHVHTRAWWPTRSEHLFPRIRPAGFYLLSVFVYRLPAANRPVKNDAKTSHEEAVPDVGYRAEKTGAVYFSSRKRKFQRFVPSLPLNPKSHGDSVIDTGCEVKCIVEIFSEGRYVIVREIVLGFFIGPCTALCSVHALIVLGGIREGRNLINFFSIGGF